MENKDEMRKTLHKQSKLLAAELKRNALPNKDTGLLDYSIRPAGYSFNDDGSYTIKAEAVYYAKYLNAKTDFINKSINTVLPDIIYEIQQHEFQDIIYQFEIRDTKTKYKNRTKR